MKIISMTILGLFFMLVLSSTAFADSAAGLVNISEVQNNPASGGGGGSRIITIYNLNITNGTAEAVPEQIIIPTPIISKNDSERKILFDIGVKINKKQIFTGENLTSAITLINLGVPGRVNVTAIYRIIDSVGNTVYQESEIVSVETQLEFLKEFSTINLEEGEYTLLAEIKYEGQKEPARADDTFSVNKTFMQKFGRVILLVLGIVVISLLVMWIIFKKRVYLERMTKKR